MKVSVLIPTYNRAYILGEALESALSQTYSDFEILVIDDGSKDNTSFIVQQYADPRLRYVRHAKNKGYSAACNTGFREADGVLISFLDSDDLWTKDKLLTETAFLRRHPEAAAVFSDLEKRDGAIATSSFIRNTPFFSTLIKEKLYPQETVFGQREMYLCLLREVPIKPTALTMRKEAVVKTGFFKESWPSGSDWEFLIRFARAYRFGYIDRRLATLRVLNDATHRTYAIEDKSMILNLLRNEKQDLQGDEEALVALKWGYANITKHLAWSYQVHGRKSEAVGALLQGYRETGDFGLLIRALFSVLPMTLINSVRNVRRVLSRE